jgi:hypothetical protein
MEQPGRRWTAERARAVIHVRDLDLTEEREQFHEHRRERERGRPYTRTVASRSENHALWNWNPPRGHPHPPHAIFHRLTKGRPTIRARIPT